MNFSAHLNQTIEVLNYVIEDLDSLVEVSIEYHGYSGCTGTGLCGSLLSRTLIEGNIL